MPIDSTAAFLADLQRRLASLERAPALRYASIGPGGLPVTDADGNTQVVIGQQPDGSYGIGHVTGSDMPVPDPPSALALAIGGIAVTYLGTHSAGTSWPADTDRVDIFVITDAQRTELEGFATAAEVEAYLAALTPSDAYRTPFQGVRTVAALTAGAVHHVFLQAVNAAGERSKISLFATATPGSAVSPEELEANNEAIQESLNSITQDLAGVTNTYFNNVALGEAVPDGAPGDLWFRPDLGHSLWKWDEAATSHATLKKWVKSELDTAAFAARAVTTAVLARNAVTVEELADNAVDFNKLADAAVAGAKLADSAVSAIKIADGAVENAKIAERAIDSFKLGDSAVTADKLANAAVEAVKIADGAVLADKIAARAITAAHLVVSDTTDLVVDPYAAGDRGVTIGNGYASDDPTGSAPYARVWQLGSRDHIMWVPTTADGTPRGGISAGAPTQPGEEWLVEAYICATDAARSPLNLGVWFRDAAQADNVASYTGTFDPRNYRNTWTKVSVTVTVPEVTWSLGRKPATAWPFLQIEGLVDHSVDGSGGAHGGWLAAGWHTRRRSAGELIVDGAITTDKLGANAVKAGKIDAGAITANKLNVVVGGGNLWSNSSFDNAETTGSYLTGWDVYSNDGATTASRVAGRTGGYAYRASWTAESTSPQGFLRAHPTGWKVGTWYTISFYARADGPAIGRMPSEHYNPPSPTVVEWLARPALTGEWQRYVMRFQRPTTGDAMYFGVVASEVGAKWVEYDDVQLEEGDVATAYTPKTDEILPGTIASNMIAADAVTARTIKAGEISVDKLSVASIGDNLVFNGGFEEVGAADVAPIGWAGFGPVYLGKRNVAGHGVHSGSWAMEVYSDGGVAFGQSRFFPVKPGSDIYLSAAIKHFYGNPPASLRLVFYDATKTYLGVYRDVWYGQPTDTWTVYEGQARVPADARFSTVEAISHASGSNFFDSIVARQVTVSAQIGDGAITAEKLTIASTGENVVLNGSFEEVAAGDSTLPAGWLRNTGWAGSHAGSVALTSEADSGTRAVRLSVADSSDYASASIGGRDFAPAAAGETWYLSARVKSPQAGGVYLRLGDKNGGEIYANGLEDLTVNGNTWRTLEGVFTIPAGWTHIRPWLLLHGPGNAPGNYLDVDNIVLRKVVVSAQIADGAITTRKLVAGAVTAETLSVGSASDSLLVNPGFEDWTASDTRPVGWIKSTNETPTLFKDSSAARIMGVSTPRWQASATAWTGLATEASIPTLPSRSASLEDTVSYYLAGTFKGSAYVTNGARIVAEFRDVNGAVVSTQTQTRDLDTVPTKRTFVVNVPVSAGPMTMTVKYEAAPNANTPNVWLDEAEARRLVGGAQIARASIVEANIADLAVTNAKIGDLNAGKINAGFLNAARIQTGSLSAGVINANTITADFLKSNGAFIGALETTSFSSVTITGSTIKTSASATTNGVVIDSAGLRMYSGGGAPKIDLPSNGGTATFTGAITGGTITGTTFQTASSGTRVEILAGNSGAVRLYSGASSVTLSYANGLSVSGGISSQGNEIVGGSLRATSGTITAQSGSINSGYAFQILGGDVIDYSRTFVGYGGVNTSGRISGYAFEIMGNNVINNSRDWVGAGIYAGSNSVNGGDFNASRVYISSPGSATATPNLRITGGSGQILLTSHANSSRRYKKNIETLDLSDEQLFGLRPVAYELKKQPVDRDPGHVFWGFIAEELQELGFSTLLEFDEQGRPDEVDYSKVTAVLAAQTRRLNERALEQQQQIADLTDQVASLTRMVKELAEDR